MKLNESVINFLDPLADIENMKPFLFQGDGDMSLKIEGRDLLKVGKNGIMLLNQCNLDKKIIVKEKNGVQNTKICLGLGTKSRGTEYKRLFKKII